MIGRTDPEPSLHRSHVLALLFCPGLPCIPAVPSRIARTTHFLQKCKENRDHKAHEYVCDCCGFHSNDDRVGAMNLQVLGTMYVSGDDRPRFRVRKKP